MLPYRNTVEDTIKPGAQCKSICNFAEAKYLRRSQRYEKRERKKTTWHFLFRVETKKDNDPIQKYLKAHLHSDSNIYGVVYYCFKKVYYLYIRILFPVVYPFETIIYSPFLIK